MSHIRSDGELGAPFSKQLSDFGHVAIDTAVTRITKAIMHEQTSDCVSALQACFGPSLLLA